MWCTRWYLPLVLLPLPIAPPFFLVLFLLSLTLHARPCFYCIVLLTAFFLSSCYWPPLPIDTQLSTPWSDNVTTYADAVMSLLPDLPKELIPSEIPIADRCWCDLTSGKFFEPYDVSRWEMESIIRLKEDIETKRQVHPSLKPQESGESETTESSVSEVPAVPALPPLSKLASLLRTVWSFPPASGHHPRTPDPPIPRPTASSDEALPGTPTIVSLASGAAEPTRLPRLRREYDLRSLGFEMIVDFGWSGKKG